jgi:hypothetical protein
LLRCSRCKSIHYCTVDHQRQHWMKHKVRMDRWMDRWMDR